MGFLNSFTKKTYVVIYIRNLNQHQGDDMADILTDTPLSVTERLQVLLREELAKLEGVVRGMSPVDPERAPLEHKAHLLSATIVGIEIAHQISIMTEVAETVYNEAKYSGLLDGYADLIVKGTLLQQRC